MIIGITGWFAAGKDTAADYLAKEGFIVFSLSDFLRQELTNRKVELSRDNLRNVGNELREKHGPSYLAEVALKKMQSMKEKNFVISSIRQPAEAKYLKKTPNFVLWEIKAPAKTRFKRLKKRARTEDEKSLTIEEFQEKENKERAGGPNCQQLDRVVKLADTVIDNGGTFKDLYQKIDQLLGEKNGQIKS